MRRRLLATLALLGALTGSVLFGAAAPAELTLADGGGDDSRVAVGVNRGW